MQILWLISWPVDNRFKLAIDTMSKTEIFLLLIILLILGSALWFIFSDEIWVLVSYLETSLYPTLITPE
ncbi:hypothetical protein EGH67_15640 [Klebsiella aerogenes]|uniref:Ecr family regulatory small membrane protein n=2 Tax=Klebsiella aerogenes TaxID=548 RepID=A0A0H3G2P7_KLEAK|nr:hypothetical protein EAE_22725 [Klebsiella aerogenes KCTC 2190]AKK79826.1 hypothetical protein ABY61_00620 [Klebsiella aerogenes]AMH08332.1 hypothetical protein AL511_03860 [Klebsiella aerogenes]AMQ58239.1 hypothetical protein AL497_00180 [Klebsiella aerogenes]ATM91956.1 hypothetical protein CRN78_16010 [Klebsiella aerogenes]